MAWLDGPAFTWAILTLYALRCVSYAFGGHWGRAAYWLCAAGITVSAEFLMRRWP
jgi:hypothetical protein